MSVLFILGLLNKYVLNKNYWYDIYNAVGEFNYLDFHKTLPT